MFDNLGFRQIARVMGEFRSIYGDIPATTVHVFVEIAMNPGVSSKELIQSVGTSQSAVSRNLAILSEYSWRGGEGLDLIESIEDPEDRRNKIHFLKPKGRALALKLIGIMSPKVAPPAHEDFPTATNYVRSYRTATR